MYFTRHKSWPKLSCETLFTVGTYDESNNFKSRGKQLNTYVTF